MGDLLKETRAASKKPKVEQLVAALGDEGNDLVEALKDPNVSLSAIRQALSKRGLKVASSTLSLWRQEHGVA